MNKQTLIYLTMKSKLLPGTNEIPNALLRVFSEWPPASSAKPAVRRLLLLSSATHLNALPSAPSGASSPTSVTISA